MKNNSATTPCTFLVSLAMLALLPCGCHQAGKSDSDSSAGQSSQQQGGNGGQKGGSGSQTQLTEPASSTTGQATGAVVAESDDGTPRAVAHSSTAMPAAPESTLNGKQQDKRLNSPESQSGPPAPPQ